MSDATVPDKFPADQMRFMPDDPDKQWAHLHDWVLDNLPNVDADTWLEKFETIREEHARNFEQHLKKNADGIEIVGAEEKPDDEQQEQATDDHPEK